MPTGTKLLMRRSIRCSGPSWRRVAEAFSLAAMAAVSCGPPPEPAAPSFDVAEKTILELAAAMEGGEVTSRQLVEQYLARIEAFDHQGPELNAMVARNPKAVEQAEALDAERAAQGPRGPLHGVPVIVKDNYDTSDIPTTGGSIALAGLVPPDDAFQVRKLREAGAVILGKANMHELAYGITTISSLGGQTRNPYDPARNPGGSSGGTGAAIAASYAAVGMGSDTCGSIRIPASHNNLVGLRSTRGLASRDGIIPLSHTQDVGGPLARSVTDLAIVFDATVGFDPADEITALGADQIPASYLDHLRADGLQGARIGILRTLFGEAPEDQQVARVVNAAIEKMEEQGAETLEVTIPDFRQLLQGASVLRQEFGFDLQEYLRNTPGAPVSSLEEILDQGLYHAAVEGALRRSSSVDSLDTEGYRDALAKRETIRATVVQVMQNNDLDALVYPTIRRTASRIGESQSGSNCSLSANSGLPAISVPAGFANNGMPVGVELLGRPFAEPRLLELAYSFEQAADHRRPPASVPSLWREDVRVAFDVRATGSAEVPPVDTRVVADARFTLDRSTRTLSYRASVFGVTSGDVLFMHIHRGHQDEVGPVVFLMSTAGASRVSGSFTLTLSALEDLKEGNLYFDVHTTQNRAGEVRGQLVLREPSS